MDNIATGTVFLPFDFVSRKSTPRGVTSHHSIRRTNLSDVHQARDHLMPCDLREGMGWKRDEKKNKTPTPKREQNGEVRGAAGDTK